MYEGRAEQNRDHGDGHIAREHTRDQCDATDDFDANGCVSEESRQAQRREESNGTCRREDEDLQQAVGERQDAE